MLNLKTLTLAVLMASATASASDASVYLSKTLLPVVDIDGGGIADARAASNSVASFDILFSSMGAAPVIGRSYGFAVEIADLVELLSLGSVSTSSGVSIIHQNYKAVAFKYTPTFTPVNNAVLATFSFNTGQLGLGADDDNSDFSLSGLKKWSVAAAGVIDPLTNSIVKSTVFDVQQAPTVGTVPLPATGLLLVGALGLLGLRKRSA